MVTLSTTRPATKVETRPAIASRERRAEIGLGIGRIVVGLLWFSQLWWKLPPTFGCQPGFAFSTREQTTSGLCDWTGREAAYAGNLHAFNIFSWPS